MEPYYENLLTINELAIIFLELNAGEVAEWLNAPVC